MRITNVKWATTLLAVGLVMGLAPSSALFAQQGGNFGGGFGGIQPGNFGGNPFPPGGGFGFGGFGMLGGGCNGNLFIMPVNFGGGVGFGGVQPGNFGGGGFGGAIGVPPGGNPFPPGGGFGGGAIGGPPGGINKGMIGPGGFGGFIGFMPCGGPLAMLMNPEVQKDLMLSKEQTKKVKDLMAKEQKNQQALSKLAPQQQMQKIQEMTKARDKAVQAILKKDQSERLKQIDLQMKGASALNEPAVGAKLKISAEQKDQMKSVQMEAMKEMMKTAPGLGFGGKPPATPQELKDFQKKMQGMQETMQKQQKVAQEKVFDVLTTEQRQQWQELIGEPFPRSGSSARPKLESSPGTSSDEKKRN